MTELQFDGKVVIVTGAGGGLGKAYALLFAERGASVVVNDLGGSPSGEGASARAADLVVNEIKAKGGNAVADYNSVEEGEKIIETAIKSFGRIDVLINNAGILRDRSFAKTSNDDWDLVHRVHLRGSFITSRAAWPYFRKQNYGRIIMTSSVAGIYGNFGQANYSAAKLGLVGLSNSLAIEGRKNNIHTNTIVPMAGSRLTQGILPPDLMEGMKPELIAPVVLWLCHETCRDNGAIIEAAAGWVGKYRWQRSQGKVLRESANALITPESVRDNWSEITNMDNCPLYPSSNPEAAGLLAQVLQDLWEKDAKNVPQAAATGPASAVDWKPKPTVVSFEVKDLILYALAVGVSTADEDHLKFLYEGSENFEGLPTFAILLAQEALSSSGALTGSLPGMEFDLSKVLHGEQYLEIVKPLPTSGTFYAELRVADVLDKGSGALIVMDVDVKGEDHSLYARTQFAIFIVGAGRFNGPRSSDKLVAPGESPKRDPDAVLEYKTSVDQAALYRLCGDRNPLHIDPSFAAMGGFDKPILHGLCSYGIAIRLIVGKFARNDPKLVKAVKARFARSVVPGQTLVVKAWLEGKRVHFISQVKETGQVVLTGGYVDLLDVQRLQNVKPLETNLRSATVFTELRKRLGSNPELVKKIKAVFQWNISQGGKIAQTWTLDLKNGNGNVYEGEPKSGKADCILTLDDGDFIGMVNGQLNAQKAYLQGKLKVTGNIMLSQKLQELFRAQAKM